MGVFILGDGDVAWRVWFVSVHSPDFIALASYGEHRMATMTKGGKEERALVCSIDGGGLA